MKVPPRSPLFVLFNAYPLLVVIVAVTVFAGAGLLGVLGLSVPLWLLQIGGMALLVLGGLVVWLAALIVFSLVIRLALRCLIRGRGAV